MSAWVIAAIAFACLFGGTLLGLLLRAALPEHHFDDRSKDIVGLGTGLVATMAALVLGLLVASAKSSYDAARNGLNEISANLLLLDGTLAEYGPDAQGARNLLRHNVTLAIARIWPEDESQAPTAAPETAAGARYLFSRIQALAPANDRQRELRSQALQIDAGLGQARWLLVAQVESSPIPVPFLVVLIFWLILIFTSLGLFAPPNATVITTLFVCALSASGAIFLILELAQPLDGIIKISGAPLRAALAHLGQ